MSTAPPDTRALSPEVVADEYLGCHKVTVYRLIERGQLPAVKVGGRWKIRREDVEALLAGAR